MTEHEHDELRRLFDLALAASADARDAILDRECNDGALKQRILDMIAAAEDDRFLGAPTAERPLDEQPQHDTLADSTATDFEHGRFEPGERLGSRYRIVGLLGRGGMGDVYRADDLELGQPVALKFLPERVATDPAWLRRIRNEVRTARQVAHANVCRIYDIGEVDGHVFLSMEYIDGEDLAGVLRRLGRPSREKAVEIARQICLGLASAHENNVLHRDLKPANIMIDGRGRVRITDFGLAGFLDELEHAEARAGTPAYMAPEQLTHGKVSVRSDIYSLGLILHELFTGECVFETSDIEELKRRHSSGSTSRPSSIAEDIDPAVERVIARCLEPQPEERPQSVYQVLAGLPGGDPLAAALAAGETPSPELVKNARDSGGLSPRVAIGLLVFVLAFLGAVFAFTGSPVMPERAPQELSFVAGQIMEELGYDELPRNSVSGFNVNNSLDFGQSGLAAPELAELRWPPKYRYWRRWSAGSFEAVDFHFPERFRIDGPTDRPEDTATVALDSTGRLLGLLVGPGLAAAGPDPAHAVDFSPLFRVAQLEEADGVEVAAVRPPPVHCDTLIAWRFDALRDQDDEPATIQMGAVRGRPNYLEVVGLDHARMMGRRPGDGERDTTAEITKHILMTVLHLFVIPLAWRNLRAGRGDRQSAFRCALIVALLYLLFEVLSAQGAWIAVSLALGRAGGHVALHALSAWFIYMAIEPYVRRVWPRMLVGLVRLLSGRVRDPAVGREALVGVAVCMVVVIGVVLFLPSQPNTLGKLAREGDLAAMMSPGRYLAGKAHMAAWAVAQTLLLAGALIVIRFLTRRTLPAVLLGVVVIGVLHTAWMWQVDWFSAWQIIACGALFGTVFVLLYVGVGIVAAFVMNALLLTSHGGIGTDLDAWFTPYGLAELAIPFAVAVYGFWVSLAGKPLFKDMLADPRPA